MNRTPTTKNDLPQSSQGKEVINCFWPKNTFICLPHPITDNQYHIQ
jgi:hypothetical protein